MPTTKPTTVPIQKIGPADETSAWKSRSKATSWALVMTARPPAAPCRARLHARRVVARRHLDDAGFDPGGFPAAPCSTSAKVRSLIITVPSLMKSGPSAKLPTMWTVTPLISVPRRSAMPRKRRARRSTNHRIRRFQPRARRSTPAQEKTGWSGSKANAWTRKSLPSAGFFQKKSSMRRRRGARWRPPGGCRAIELAAGTDPVANRYVRACMMMRSASSWRHRRQRGIEKAALEAELHEHQQHGKPDPGARSHQPPLVGDEVAPGERDRMQPGSAGGRKRSTRSAPGSKHVGRIGPPQAAERQ